MATDDSRRLDKWLWFARFFKSRTLASRFCQSGRLRVNQAINKKAHHALRVGDVLTFPLGPHVRVIKVVDLGQRRGPALEARTLYEDLSPPQLKPKSAAPDLKNGAVARRQPGAGRPTKSERRAIDRLRGD